MLKKTRVLEFVIDCLEHDDAFQIVGLHVLEGEVVVLHVVDLAVGDLDGLLGAHGLGVGAHAVDGHDVLLGTAGMKVRGQVKIFRNRRV